MPRVSNKQHVLRRLEQYTIAAIKHARRQKLLGICSLNIQDFALCCRHVSAAVRNNRYLSRGKYRKRTERFDSYLDPDHPDALSDREFRFHFRLSRESFSQLVELIKDHGEFQRKSSDSRGKDPKPAAHQLLILMKYLGTEGNGASSIAIGHFFGIGAGVVNHCRNSALMALLSLEDRTYRWPNSDERRCISARIKEDYLWPNCVGIIDGTLLPLAMERTIFLGRGFTP